MDRCMDESASYAIPSEIASFRWKFADSDDFLKERMFVIDSEMIWDEYIASKRFNSLLEIYNEPNVLLYFY